MSMSESERQQENQRLDSSLLVRQELGLPEDFTDEDMIFAQEMDALFSLDEEEIPPYYVQTLLEAEDPRLQPVEQGLEYKTSVRVFRQLKLKRRLFQPAHSALASVAGKPSLRRSLVALFAACFLFMFLTMVATGPSFASGLTILLSGKHGGVLQSQGYPRVVHSSTPLYDADRLPVPSAKHVSLLEAQQQLRFPMYWPLSVPTNYDLHAVHMYQDVDQNWADGPVMEIDYAYAHPGVSSHGTGQISVCEFKPKGQVLQVVQLGAAHYVQIDSDGRAQAIYVDGQWVRINNFSHDWLYGGRSEIIYEHNDVIFWIVGDQRDGIDQRALLSVANSLQPVNARAMHMGGRIDQVMLNLDDTSWPFAGEVVYTDGPSGASMKIVSADFSSPNTHRSVN